MKKNRLVFLSLSPYLSLWYYLSYSACQSPCNRMDVAEISHYADTRSRTYVRTHIWCKSKSCFPLIHFLFSRRSNRLSMEPFSYQVRIRWKFYVVKKEEEPKGRCNRRVNFVLYPQLHLQSRLYHMPKLFSSNFHN